MTGLVPNVRGLASALAATAALLAAGASPAAAQSAAAQPAPTAHVVDWWPDPARAQPATGWPARLQPAARAALDALADSARAAELPLAPLYDKAAEGVLKRADDARIVDAVRRLAQRLSQARAALGPTASSGDLQVGASALAAGVPRDSLRAIGAAHATRRRAGGVSGLAVSLSVVADLVTRGVPPDVAASSLRVLIERGVPEGEMSAVWQRIRADIEAGEAPGAAAHARTRAVVERLDGAAGERAAPRPRIVRPEDAPGG